MLRRVGMRALLCIHPAHRAAVRARIDEAVAGGQERVALDVRAIRRDGCERWLHTWGCLRREGDAITLYGCVLDVTKQRETEAALREKSEENAIVARQSGKSVLRYDFAADIAYGYGDTAGLFGVRSEMADFIETAVRSGIVRPQSEKTFRALFAGARSGRASGADDVLLRTASGAERWFHVDYTLMCGEDGAPSHAIVSFFDNTRQREREIAYARWERGLDALLAQSVAYQLINLTSGRVESQSGLLGKMPENDEAPDEPLAERVKCGGAAYTEDETAFNEFFDRDRLISLYRRGIDEDALEYRRLNAAGEQTWFRARVRLIASPDSEDIKAVITYENIDQARREMERLAKVASRDALTGLLNREATERRIRRALADMPQDERGAMFMIDLDNFKHINDHRGHQAGDSTLSQVAGAIRDVFRADDIVGRVGGDEFMAFLPGGASEKLVYKKAAALIESLQFSVDGVNTTASVGVALTNGGDTFEKLYYQADMALYQAKNSGKSRFFLAGGEAPAAPVREEAGDGRHFSVQFKTLLEHMDGGIMLARMEGNDVRVTYVSPSFYKSLRRDKPQAGVGCEQILSLVYPPDLPALLDALRVTARQGTVADITYRVGHRGQEWRRLNAARLPGEGEAELIAVITDVTNLKRTEETLRIATDRYRMALRLTGGLIWEVDVHARTFSVSPEAARALRLTESCFPDAPEGALRAGFIHPDSHNEFRRMIGDIYAGREGGHYTVIATDEKGGYTWTRAGFELMRGERGEALRAIGVVERVENIDFEMRAFEQEAQFESLIEPSLLGSARVNLSKNVCEHVKFSGLEGLDADGIHTYDALFAFVRKILAEQEAARDYDRSMTAQALLEAYKAGKSWIYNEFYIRLPGGGRRWVSRSVSILRQPVSGEIYLFVYLRDSNARKRWELAAGAPVQRDMSTYLYTRETTRVMVDSALRQARDTGELCALTVAEISGLRGFSDEKGVKAMNDTLFAIGRLFRTLVEGDVIVGRLNESQAVIFRMNAPPQEQMQTMIEARRERILSHLKCMGAGEGVALYFGFAVERVSGASFDALLASASLACSTAIQWKERPVAAYFEPHAAARNDAEKARAEGAADARKTLLIADDDRTARAILSRLLQADYNVLEAEDGERALEMLRENPNVSLLLLDIMMPRLDGFGVLERLKDDRTNENMPVIVVTADDNTESVVRALDRGATDVIAKPYQPKIILSRIRNTLSRMDAQRISEQNHAYELRFQQQANLIRMMEYDELTGLYSKQAFFRRVREKLEGARGGEYMLVRCDIDRFKAFNDMFGSQAGDKLLRDMAGECVRRKRKETIVARMDADHFILFGAREEAAAERFHRFVTRWLAAYPAEFRLASSMGVYVIDEPELDVSRMCDRALMALRTVKDRYDNKLVWYDEKLRSRMLDDHQLVGDMAEALKQEQFEVYYQPQVNYENGAIIGAEALVRWNHPRRGFLTSGAFVPLFEGNGAISALDEYVWERSCRFMRAWLDAGNAPVPISVNISRMDIYNPRLCENLRALVARYDLAPASLKLEITESAYMDNPKQLLSTVETLRGMGFVVEMDDFGSGYSSLNTLKDVEVDILKLDMQFLSDCRESSRGGSILSSIVRMARWLDLPVLAEGVETREQADYLLSIGCPYMQGFYFAKPMPEEAFKQLLRKSKTGAIAGESA